MNLMVTKPVLITSRWQSLPLAMRSKRHQTWQEPSDGEARHAWLHQAVMAERDTRHFT